MASLLIVDDEELLRRSLRRILEHAGHAVAEAASVGEAQAILDSQPIDLVLCDINMPGQSGLELVRSVAAKAPDTTVIMLTGVDDPAVAEEALRIGAYGYLVKPAERNEVLINVASVLRRRELELAQRDYVHELESKVIKRSTALHEALERLGQSEVQAREAEREIVDRLVTALTLRSEETGAHIRRVGAYSALLARAAGTSTPKFEEIRLAAMLHDIGKIGIPDAILLKPGPLSDEELRVMQRHPILGKSMLENGRARVVKIGAEIALTHHERWDGGGYPYGLAGEHIPLSGRIVAIADVFDALTSDRVYREALPVATATSEISRERERHFDPTLLDLFLASIGQIESIRSAHPENTGPVLPPGPAGQRGASRGNGGAA